MSNNPYQTPQYAQAEVVGVNSGRREDLRSVAQYQKGIMVCILIYLILVFVQFAIPDELGLLLVIGVIALGLTGTVFVFLLSTKVFSTGVGILLGILTLVPCIGLITLLIVNGRATAILKRNGIRVGLLGANMSQL